MKIFNKMLPGRIGNDLCCENTKFYDKVLTKVKNEAKLPKRI